MTVWTALLLLLVAVPSYSQVPKSLGDLVRERESLPTLEPNELLLIVGSSQPFQLLDRDGNEVRSDGWSVSDAKIAELTIDDGRPVLTGKSPGRVALRTASGIRSGEILVRDADAAVSDTRWLLQPIDGRFVNVLWASSTWGASVDGNNFSQTAPSYYYEDRGPASTHLRAIRADGLQVWQWPKQGSREVPRLICGDFFGGVLLQVGEQASRILINLDPEGRERWRAAVPGFSGKGLNVTPDGIVYLIEEEAAGSRLVGLDARTGSPRFSFKLDGGTERLRNLRIRDGRPVCAPGVDTATPTPPRHSTVITNVDGRQNLAYSEMSLTADAEGCQEGSPVAFADIHLQVTDRLRMIDIDDLRASVETIEQSDRDGDAAAIWIEALEPTGDIIPSPDAVGNLLSVRKSRVKWLQPGTKTSEEFVFRVAGDRTVQYRFPVPDQTNGRLTVTLLGNENKVGYTARGRAVIAFDTETARELWRWVSPSSDVQAIMVSSDETILVHEGDDYVMVKAGQAVDRRAEDFMLFVMKWRPNFEDD